MALATGLTTGTATLCVSFGFGGAADRKARRIAVLANLLISSTAVVTAGGLDLGRSVEFGLILLMPLTGYSAFSLGIAAATPSRSGGAAADAGHVAAGLGGTDVPAFSVRSIAGALVVGLFLGAGLTTLTDVPWQLAIPTGLAAGAIVLVWPVSFESRFGRENGLLYPFAWLVICCAAFLGIPSLELEPAVGSGLSLFMFLTGIAGLRLGVTVAVLDQVDADTEHPWRATLSLGR